MNSRFWIWLENIFKVRLKIFWHVILESQVLEMGKRLVPKIRREVINIILDFLIFKRICLYS